MIKSNVQEKTIKGTTFYGTQSLMLLAPKSSAEWTATGKFATT